MYNQHLACDSCDDKAGSPSTTAFSLAVSQLDHFLFAPFFFWLAISTWTFQRVPNGSERVSIHHPLGLAPRLEFAGIQIRFDGGSFLQGERDSRSFRSSGRRFHGITRVSGLSFARPENQKNSFTKPPNRYLFFFRKACCGLRILHVWGPTKSTISKDCAIQNS